MKFGIEVTGIDIVTADLVGIVPVQIVQLYLHEVPMIFLIEGQHLVEHRLLTMERETEVTYAACLTLFHQIIHHAVLDIAADKLIITASNGMQQIVVDIVYLQLLQRVMIHLDGLLPLPVVAVKVGELRGNEILAPLMPAKGDACTLLRLTLTIDWRRIEIVHAMLDGIVYLTVDHLLIELAVVVHLCRKAHHAITQE